MKGYIKLDASNCITELECCDCGEKATGVGIELGFTGRCGCGGGLKRTGMYFKKPRVICFVEGGVVHDVMADQPVTLRIIDYDVDGCDDVDKIHLVGENNVLNAESEDCHIIKYDLEGIEDLNPFFKQECIR